jgi:NAD(P)-dependent dehydrogenase (short-subunit alcohol dehydrogenase family)
MARVVVITGCSSGIGKTIALAFARRGDRVYATMRSPARGTALRAALDDGGLDAEVLALDVTDEASVRIAIAAVTDREGQLDVVVNNAGIGTFAPVERSTDDDWRATLETNLLGPVRVARAALPIMREQHSGTIVNISSIAGRMASIPTQGAYAASKHAVCAFTDSLVGECSAFGIRAYCIEPGFFATSIIDNTPAASLDDADPYKPLADGIEQFFRASVAAAPPPDAVADLVIAAADGVLGGGIHHPVGAAGFLPTENAARSSG